MAPIHLAGPTASGKSAAALLLAQRLGGEIISVDSMQVYAGLDIGTAKPSRAERAHLPHHLIDVARLDEEFHAARFLALARQAEEDIASRGRVPIYCGGTGLYFNVLLGGLGTAPPPDQALRELIAQTPLEELLAELEARDPEAFNRIDRANPRRVRRAIEVMRSSGIPLQSQRADWKQARPQGRWFGLERPREELARRIEARVEQMFRAGLVEETRGLVAAGLEQNRTAAQALGYRQVLEHLRGVCSLEETIAIVKAKTRQYAKRQRTWFKRQLPLEWIAVPEGAGAEWIASAVEARLAQPPATI